MLECSKTNNGNVISMLVFPHLTKIFCKQSFVDNIKISKEKVSPRVACSMLRILRIILCIRNIHINWCTKDSEWFLPLTALFHCYCTIDLLLNKNS